MRLHRSLTALLALVVLAGCEKNAVPTLTGPLPSASIKFYNFAVDAPAVHFYAGDRKMTATTTTLCSAAKSPPVTANDTLCLTQGRQSTLGVTYGNVGAGDYYVGIDPGSYTVAARLAADQATVVSSTTATIEAGKNYSYFQSGIYNSTGKTADAFILEDALSQDINWTVATVRFVNAISNSQPMTLYATNTETGQEYAIGGAVAYKSGSTFTEIPSGSYDLSARAAGTTSSTIARSNVGFEFGRTYTITARGDMTVTSSTAADRPVLDFTVNR